MPTFAKDVADIMDRGGTPPYDNDIYHAIPNAVDGRMPRLRLMRRAVRDRTPPRRADARNDWLDIRREAARPKKLHTVERMRAYVSAIARYRRATLGAPGSRGYAGHLDYATRCDARRDELNEIADLMAAHANEWAEQGRGRLTRVNSDNPLIRSRDDINTNFAAVDAALPH